MDHTGLGPQDWVTEDWNLPLPLETPFATAVTTDATTAQNTPRRVRTSIASISELNIIFHLFVSPHCVTPLAVPAIPAKARKAAYSEHDRQHDSTSLNSLL